MRLRATIATRLTVAYLLFLTPIGYLGCQMISGKEAQIDFASKEIMGVRYISEVLDVQGMVVRGSPMAPMIERIRANETANWAPPGTARSVEILLKALMGTDRPAAAQAAADLIGKAADGSDLTLDPDLDSFYSQDALTVKIPTAVAQAAALGEMIANMSERDLTVDGQVRIGMARGALQQVLDGLASDIDSAAKGNPDKTVGHTVAAAAATASEIAKVALATLANPAQAANAMTVVRPLLDALTVVGSADAHEVEHLLGARIARFRMSEMIDLAIASVLFLVAIVYVIVILQRNTIRPLGSLTRDMAKLAENDLTVEISGLARGDEIGAMAAAMRVFKDNMIETSRLRAEQETQKQETEQKRRQGMLDLAAKFEAGVGGIVGQVASAATELQSTAQTLAATSEETTRQSTTVTAASEQATQNVQTVASATEELSASIQEISQQVTQASAVIQASVEQADQSNEQMRGLMAAAEKIGDVVSIISDIAGQTNLLALNATIEAARAGDAGKGFAVVASEVKALANQTTRATGEIAAQIKAIQEATQSSARLIGGIAETIAKVNETTAAIASAVEEQGAATQEISRNVLQAAQGTQAVSRNIAGVSEAAQQTGTAAAQVLASAGELSRNGEALRAQVAGFLHEVRAA